MSATMTYVPPVAISGAKFVSSTVAETDYAAWLVGTTYALGDRCINTTTHRIYQSVQAGNIGHDPTTDATATWWVNVGPTNRWAMFDTAVSSQTTATTTFTVVIAPGEACDTLGLINLTNINSASVTMTSDAVEVYARTLDLAGEVGDWAEYFFSPIETRSEAIFTGLPYYANGVVTIVFTGSGTIGCGALVIGRAVTLGLVRYGVTLGIIDYSRKTTDDFGVTTFVERGYKKRYDVDMVIENANLDALARQLAAVRATPTLWIGSQQYDSLIAFGTYNDWQVEIAYYQYSHLSLRIEGLL